MAQYGAQKNPPWVRDGSLPQPGVAVVGGLGQPVPVATPTVYSLSTTQLSSGQPQYTQLQQQLGVANLSAVAPLPQPGIAIPTTLATSQINQVQNVSYPAPRSQVHNVGGTQPKQRVFTGTVTKLHDSFGFVDEDVFFQTSCVKGTLPKVGDRVLVEASYNANMPFKWNATRIQVLPQQQKAPLQPTPPGLVQGFNTSKPPPSMQQPHSQPQFTQPPPPLMSQNTQPPPNMRNQVVPPPGSRRLDPPSYDRGNRDRERDRSRSSPPRRARSPAPRKRSRSPRRRSRSPARRISPVRRSRPQRVVPRYLVQVPKISLDTKEANVIAIKCRYTNMYIPSDFFHSSFSWVDAFPLHRPFELGKQCTYHVMHKEVDPIVKNDAIFEPPDADHLYSAKVMLSASPTLDDLHKKSCAFVEDSSDNRDNLQHPTRLVNFLVGMKGKEPMAIGGPWSPSLDGSSPADDPRVLINTAIRTTRALTGIDLSGITQWYRFAEIRYHRPEEVHKGRVVPARVETVVLFLPDVWSCNPSRLEWDGLAAAYKNQLAEKYKEDTQEETQDEDEEDADTTIEAKDPTHHSELDPKSMKVNDLRKELEARSLSSKGLKSQLIARLTKALKTEVEKEEEEAENKEEEAEPEPEKEPEPPVEKTKEEEKEEEKKKREDEDKKRREERERAVRERRYTLPDTPAILVHPSTTAKGGKFDCNMMSLSVLLDYRPDDNKEHTFEVSLFAELFNEMLMRDFAFRIYKALVHAPEKPKEEDKKDKKKEKDKKDRDSKHRESSSTRDKDRDSKDKEKESKDKDSKDNSRDKDNKDKESKDKDKDKETTKEGKEKDTKDGNETESKEKEEKDDTKKNDKEKDEEKDKKVKEAEEESDEPPAKKKKEDDSKDKEKKKEKDTEKKDEKKKDKDDKKDEKEKKDKDGDDDDDEDKKSVRSDHGSSSRDKSDRDKDKKHKVKYVTADSGLLLAFSYFDLSHTGYIMDKDMEEILHTVGLQLSRAQVRKLVTKCANKDQINYHKLTDVPADKKDEEKEASEKDKSSPSKSGDTSEPMETSVPDDETLSKGNKPLLPQFNVVKEESPSKTRSRSGKKESDSGNMIMYKGSMLDIPSMIQRVEKSEKLKRETDTKLKDLQEEMDMLKDSCKSSEQTSQKVALELQELKKKLRDQRKATDRSESDAKKYYEALSNIKGNLSSVLSGIQDVTGEKKHPVDVKDVKVEVNGD